MEGLGSLFPGIGSDLPKINMRVEAFHVSDFLGS